MKEPWEWTEDDILSLVNNKVCESTTLDYKACDALAKIEGKKKDISKDVSAFANSAGGTIVYGVSENAAHEPEAIDSGYGPTDISGEWLEQVINTNVERRIDRVIINTVLLHKTHPGKVLYVVYVPESKLAPHMASDGRFYRRFNFQSVPMKEYEVRNLMRREFYPSRDIVSAWRDYVINPLLSMLKEEKDYLENGKLEWERSDKSNYGLRVSYIRSQVSSSANQDQFLESYPNIQQAVDVHDKAVGNLLVRWERVYQAIKGSERLLDCYLKATTPQALQDLKAACPYDFEHCQTDEAVFQKLFGHKTERDDHLGWLAESLIHARNNVTKHAKIYDPLVNAHREQFLDVLNNQPIADCWSQVDVAIEELLQSLKSLTLLLKETLFELSKQHGIPVEVHEKPMMVYRNGTHFW